MPPLIARHHGHGLGCRFARDPRDYPLERRMQVENVMDLPERVTPWRRGPILDQGETSQCTRYSLAARRGAAPIYTREPLKDVTEGYYQWALEHDEFPGADADGGTTVRAMCQAARSFGLASAFYTTASIATVYKYIRRVGPVQVGLEWTDAMFTPDAEGFVYPTGAVAGGHAFLWLWIYSRDVWTGVPNRDDVVKCQNSWGESWGRSGICYLRVGDALELLEHRGGEAYEVVETAHQRSTE
jgi:hypothetical protein